MDLHVEKLKFNVLLSVIIMLRSITFMQLHDKSKLSYHPLEFNCTNASYKLQVKHNHPTCCIGNFKCKLFFFLSKFQINFVKLIQIKVVLSLENKFYKIAFMSIFDFQVIMN